MEDSNNPDGEIRSLFLDEREADRARAPHFRTLLERQQTSRLEARMPRRSLRLAFLTTAGSLLVALAASWLVLRDPFPVDVTPEVVRYERSRPVNPVERSFGADEHRIATAPDPVHDRTKPTQSQSGAERQQPSTLNPDSGASEPLTQTEPTVSLPSAFGIGAGGLSLQVLDDHNSPLPGAMVTLSHETGSVKTTAAETNARGVVEFPVLAAGGGYTIKVSFPGFSEIIKPDIRVKMGERQTIPVSLCQEIQERVKVTSKREVIDVAQTEAATKFSDEYISDLPVPGRLYQNVLTLAPGSRDSRMEVRSVANVNPNAIEEMEVITAGAGAELGRAQGGFARTTGGQVAPEEPELSGPGFNTESYSPIQEGDFLTVLENPLSTFSIDVDTASYSNVRRFLRQGLLPPRDAVRIEELLNYFRYDYPDSAARAPFSASVEVAGCPWNGDHRLVRIGLKGREVSRRESSGSNLVFLLDVSGSMQEPAKLPLVKKSLALLVDELDGSDRVAMVVYAGASGLVLPSTSGASKADIREAIDRLQAGGSTNGGDGLRLAYKIAREHFIPGGVNRVILATDGDFNVGVTSQAELLELIQKDAQAGVFLTVLGFGMGNIKDATLEHLADRGNGNYAYIDDLREARKVLVEELGGTLVTIAKDVKIQVEFNPAQVEAYRLIGYENRLLRKEDFNDDRKDAGEVGSGHTVTALYEVVPPGQRSDGVPAVDPLKYQARGGASEAAASGELLTVRLRYKEPEGQASRLLSFPAADEGRAIDSASADLKFASAVAAFGMILRGSAHKGDMTLAGVRALAQEGLGADVGGYRAEFLELVDLAARIPEIKGEP